MTYVLLRLARRLASWEGDLPASEIQKYEFRDRDTGGADLRPSVYEIDDHADDVRRTCAEHIAAVPLDPARAVLGIACDGPGYPIAVNDGSPKFEFIKTHHREVELPDAAALTAFITLLKTRISGAMTRSATKAAVIAYARARVEARDPEWLAVVGEPNTKEWLRKLAPADGQG